MNDDEIVESLGVISRYLGRPALGETALAPYLPILRPHDRQVVGEALGRWIGRTSPSGMFPAPDQVAGMIRVVVSEMASTAHRKTTPSWDEVKRQQAGRGAYRAAIVEALGALTSRRITLEEFHRALGEASEREAPELVAANRAALEAYRVASGFGKDEIAASRAASATFRREAPGW